jgi:hypothetical protein
MLVSFRNAANKICATDLSQAAGIPQPTKASGLSLYLTTLTGVLNQELSSLEQLSAPSPLASGYHNLTASLSKVIDDLDQAGAAATSGQTSKARALLDQANSDQVALQAEAKQLDLASCKDGF